eukprot:1649520-Lingulodinium_polyedra.AAC.1
MVYARRAILSRCGRRRSTRPRYCVVFHKQYTMIRSSRPSAAAARRKSHALRPRTADSTAALRT